MVVFVDLIVYQQVYCWHLGGFVWNSTQAYHAQLQVGNVQHQV
jgi:hypothetical protein